jgi:hypothetical protein
MMGANGRLRGPLAGAGVFGPGFEAGLLVIGAPDPGRARSMSGGMDRGDGVDGRIGAWLCVPGDDAARLRRGISSGDGGGIGFAVHGAKASMTACGVE